LFRIVRRAGAPAELATAPVVVRQALAAHTNAACIDASIGNCDERCP
jgi:hypothetical protein